MPDRQHGDPEAMLARLDKDGIEHLWVVYHDYGGRGQAKTLPRESFRSAIRDGVVFAMANLDMAADDHQSAGATFLADSGDMLAVPDPRSYALLPRYPKTARMHAWLRATDGSPWDGCPRTRLQAMVDELKAEGFALQVALEPEFYLLVREENGEYVPANRTRMFSQAGLAAEQAFVEEVVTELRAMGVVVAQLGKEYGPGQYEMSVDHADPIRAVDDYFSLKEAVRDLAERRGYVATFMPKPYAHFAGCSLHVHLSLWDADGKHRPDARRSRRDVAFRGGRVVPGRDTRPRRRLDRARLADGQQLQAVATRLMGAGEHLLGLRQPLRRRPHSRRRQAAAPRIPLAGQQLPAVSPARGSAWRRSRRHPQSDRSGRTVSGRHRPPQRRGDRAPTRSAFCRGRWPRRWRRWKPIRSWRSAVGPVALPHFLAVKRHELAQYEVEVHPWERAMYLEISLAVIEVEQLPVVDVHAHPFLDKGAVTAEQFTDMTAFGGGSQAYMEEGGVAFADDVRAELQRGKRGTIYHKRMVRDLAAFLRRRAGIGGGGRGAQPGGGERLHGLRATAVCRCRDRVDRLRLRDSAADLSTGRRSRQSCRSRSCRSSGSNR